MEQEREKTSSSLRVMEAMEFKTPDRLPRWDNFDSDDYSSEFVSSWRDFKGLGQDVKPGDYYGIDVSPCTAEEGPFFSHSGFVRQDGDYELFRDSWGNLLRRRPGARFREPVENVLDSPADLDKLDFEDPADDRRYGDYEQAIEAGRKAGRLAFPTIGGLYCRSQFMRREDRLLTDMALDEAFCKALFSRVADYLTQVALQELKRTNSWETGMWISDDSANRLAPMFSPAMWEKYLLPNYSRMISTLKSQGCKRFFFHSDGNIGPFIDLLIEAGFEGLNPLEPRCGLDLVKLRERYGKKLVFFGGICNTQILPHGDKKAIEAHVRPLIELGREGGLIIGSASIGNDISPEAYDYYISLLDKYAQYR